MWLIPAAVTFLLLGVSTLGVALGERISPAPDSDWIVVSFLFAICFAGVAAVTWWKSKSLPPEPVAQEDSLSAIGDGRGQEHLHLAWIGSVGGFAIGVGLLYWSRLMAWSATEWTSLGLTLTMSGIAILSNKPLRRSLWPPQLPVIDPSKPPADLAELAASPPKAEVDADVVKLTFTWRFDGSFNSETSLGRRKEHTIRTGIRNASYQDYRKRPHPDPHEHADGVAVLAHYVENGLTQDVRHCAYLLWKEAASIGLPIAERTAFILEFVHDAVVSNASGGADSRYAKYPIETIMEKCGSQLDRSILAVALLKLFAVKVLLVVAENSDGVVRAGIGVPLTSGASTMIGEVIEFDDGEYLYCEWTSDETWSYGRWPDHQAIIAA